VHRDLHVVHIVCVCVCVIKLYRYSTLGEGRGAFVEVVLLKTKKAKQERYVCIVCAFTLPITFFVRIAPLSLRPQREKNHGK
jgi:hypothetical protein